MRTPIALSLSWPLRMNAPTARLDLVKLGSLTFEAPDEGRFPCLRIAQDALACGQTAPAILNAANEIAVAAFLDRKIGFTGIANIVEKSLDMAHARGCIIPATSLDDVLSADAEGRRLAQTLLSAT
jgi:1-deoxy-D-xylulose-5-phosphate reductoisomerase